MLLLKYNFYNNDKFDQGAEVKQPYIVSETSVSDYSDVSSIENWHELGNNLIGGFYGLRDWLKLYSELKAVGDAIITANVTSTDNARRDWHLISSADQTTIQNDFQTLNANEQKILADYSAIPEDLKHLVISNTTYWIAQETKFFAPKAAESRKARLGWVIGRIKAVLSLDDALTVQRDMRQILKGKFFGFDASNKLTAAVNTQSLISMYLFEGVEGTIEHNDSSAVGIIDYILSRVGTPYEGAGFRDYTFTVRDMTGMVELSDKVFDELKNGNF